MHLIVTTTKTGQSQKGFVGDRKLLYDKALDKIKFSINYQ